jgi:hypothetical protein
LNGNYIYVHIVGPTPGGLEVDPAHAGLLYLGIGCPIGEAYHGEPYATRSFVPEAFVTGEAKIAAATLRRRLPEAIRLIGERERLVYGDPTAEAARRTAENYVAFVELCERVEAVTGEPATIVARY